MLLLLLFSNSPNLRRYYVISYFFCMQKTYDKLVKVKIGRIDIGAQSVEAYSVVRDACLSYDKMSIGKFYVEFRLPFLLSFWLKLFHLLEVLADPALY